MPSPFSIITDDFVNDLKSIDALVSAFDRPEADNKTRIASVNSSVLLLAATFEEFIREMAKEYARWVVAAADNVESLPSTLTATAWRKTLDSLARTRLGIDRKSVFEKVLKDSRAKFDALYNFISGDLSQEIFDDLIHNEKNLRVSELNSLFRIANLKNICAELCKQNEVQRFFEETDAGVAHGLFMKKNDEFIDRRNAIAHRLNAGDSIAPDQVRHYIEFFRVTSLSLSACLDEKTK